MKHEYVPKTYWEQRLSKTLDLTTVGHAGLGRVYNSWLYRARFRALNRALKSTGLQPNGKNVAEIGCGSGAYIPFWQAHGIERLTGFDITRVSVETLQSRFPSYGFIQQDISRPISEAYKARFDIVTAFDVLFHITEDEGFVEAISNIAAMINNGGYAIISDSFSQFSLISEFHVKYRKYGYYIDILRKNGLDAIHIEPIFCTMTTTFPSDVPHYHRLARMTEFLFRVTARFARSRSTEWANHILGGGLYFVDGAFCRPGKRGPSLNILIAQKAPEIP